MRSTKARSRPCPGTISASQTPRAGVLTLQLGMRAAHTTDPACRRKRPTAASSPAAELRGLQSQHSK